MSAGTNQDFKSPRSVRGVFSLLGSAARRQFRKSTALPEFLMWEDNVRVYERRRNHRVGWTLEGKVQRILQPVD